MKQELEKSLREQPGDMGAWLVYGDWLLERHDARGALIQLEHRLAKARPEERASLRGEIDALVATHQPAWAAELPAGVVAERWRFGFATKVAVTWSDEAPALIEQALRQPLVTALRIIAPEGEGDDADGDGLDDDGEPLPRPVLDLAAFSIDASRLTELDLSYVHIAAAGAKTIAALPSLSITTLDLRYCGIGDAGLAALAGAGLARMVRRLHLQANGLTGAGLRALQGFTSIVELDLRYNDLGVAGAHALLAAPFVESLARLDLYRSDVTVEGARELARSSRLSPALRGYWRSV